VFHYSLPYIISLKLTTVIKPNSHLKYVHVSDSPWTGI